MLEEAQQVDVRVIIQYFAVAAVCVPSSRAAECVAVVLRAGVARLLPTPGGHEKAPATVWTQVRRGVHGEVELTISMLGTDPGAKASVKRWTAAFRFLHDVFSEVTKTTLRMGYSTRTRKKPIRRRTQGSPTSKR